LPYSTITPERDQTDAGFASGRALIYKLAHGLFAKPLHARGIQSEGMLLADHARQAYARAWSGKAGTGFPKDYAQQKTIKRDDYSNKVITIQRRASDLSGHD
jgi:hypothetical protein